MRAVVGDLVADALDDDAVVRHLELARPAEHGQLRRDAVHRAFAVHRLDERTGEGVLAPDQKTDNLAHRNTSTISLQYGQSCAQPYHRCRLAGTTFS